MTPCVALSKGARARKQRHSPRKPLKELKGNHFLQASMAMRS